MSVKNSLKKFLDLKSGRRRTRKAKAKSQSRRRTPPRNKNGRFRKRR